MEESCGRVAFIEDHNIGQIRLLPSGDLQTPRRRPDHHIFGKRQDGQGGIHNSCLPLIVWRCRDKMEIVITGFRTRITRRIDADGKKPFAAFVQVQYRRNDLDPGGGYPLQLQLHIGNQRPGIRDRQLEFRRCPGLDLRHRAAGDLQQDIAIAALVLSGCSADTHALILDHDIRTETVQH